MTLSLLHLSSLLLPSEEALLKLDCTLCEGQHAKLVVLEDVRANVSVCQSVLLQPVRQGMSVCRGCFQLSTRHICPDCM